MSSEELKVENEIVKRFNFTATHKIDRKSPKIRDTREVGFFSEDFERKFHADKRQLKYVIKLPSKKVEFDLKKGYKELIRYEDTSANIDNLLQCIMHNPQAFQLHSETKLSSLNTDFVCRRGLLTRLVCMPYENPDNRKIAVIRFKDTYFLCEFMIEDGKKQVANTTPRLDEMSYWGWKFEQYITSAEKDGKPDIDKPINNNEAFRSVVKSGLGDHSLVYGGEIDGIDDSIEGNNKYVEIKTYRKIDNKKQSFKFQRHKLLNYWAQSHLVGISKILCGYRDDDGVVHHIEEFQTEEIPDNLQDLDNPWKPNVCMNSLNDILKFIKDSIQTSDSKTVYLLEWRPVIPKKKKNIFRQKTDVALNQTTDPQYNFLPDWFITWDGWKTEDST